MRYGTVALAAQHLSPSVFLTVSPSAGDDVAVDADVNVILADARNFWRLLKRSRLDFLHVHLICVGRLSRSGLMK